MPIGKISRAIKFAIREATGSLPISSGKHGVVTVGAHTYGLRKNSILSFGESDAEVQIGKYCSFANGVKILRGGEHDIARVSSYPIKTRLLQNGKNLEAISKGKITIGNDVWVGVNAVILSGVTIGDGAVIGAGAVVAGDVPPYAIVVGNRAKILRYRFKDEQIANLLKIRWWDWPEAKIRENIGKFYEDVDGFISFAKEQQ